ncbi:MAG: serine protease [Cyclobacteriaceae bacterium]
MMRSIIWSLALAILLSGCHSCSRSGRKLDAQRTSLRKMATQKVAPDTVATYSPPVSTAPRKEKSLTDIVEIAEPSVFVVYTYNRTGKRIGQGTGFFIEKQGIAVSNHHVFDKGESWKIKTFAGEEYDVKRIIKQSEKFDYVIFQVKTESEVDYLPLGAALPRKGEDIVVLGNPRGWESTVSRGIVSSIRKYKGQRDALIQMDAAISPGSSGSPVMNQKGEVIGIATMQVKKCENCNFAFNIALLQDDTSL